MSSQSVSFRISRQTEDLAQTVHALSQRLVALEQRLGGLEGQLKLLRQQPRQDTEAEQDRLAPIEAHIERLLLDCRQLLSDPPAVFPARNMAETDRDGRLDSLEVTEHLEAMEDGETLEEVEDLEIVAEGDDLTEEEEMEVLKAPSFAAERSDLTGGRGSLQDGELAA